MPDTSKSTMAFSPMPKIKLALSNYVTSTDLNLAWVLFDDVHRVVIRNCFWCMQPTHLFVEGTRINICIANDVCSYGADPYDTIFCSESCREKYCSYCSFTSREDVCDALLFGNLKLPGWTKEIVKTDMHIHALDAIYDEEDYETYEEDYDY